MTRLLRWSAFRICITSRCGGASAAVGVPGCDHGRHQQASCDQGRFEKIDAGQQFLAIVDYAHTEDALERLIYTARGLTKGKVITVFGCGGDATGASGRGWEDRNPAQRFRDHHIRQSRSETLRRSSGRSRQEPREGITLRSRTGKRRSASRAHGGQERHRARRGKGMKNTGNRGKRFPFNDRR